MKSPQRALFTGFLLGLIALAPQASVAAPAGDGVVYAKAGSLWLRAGNGKGDSVRLAALPTPTEVTSIQVQATLRGALTEVGATWYWIAFGSKAKPYKLVCKGKSILSPNGRCIICADSSGKTLLYILGRRIRTMRLPFNARSYDFAGSDRLAIATDKGIWTMHPNGKQRRRLSTHVPDGDLSISPDGKRAVGHYQADPAGLYSFRLDGKASKRRLLAEGSPVSWSRDSKWLLIRQQSAACVVRALGGQYKCWDNYQPLALSADGSVIYLAKEEEGKLGIYLASTAGARPKAPQRILRGTEPAASWTIRGPEAAPRSKLPPGPPAK